MSTTIGGVRIVDMPDLGAVTDDSSVVGEHAGSGRFSAPAFRTYMAAAAFNNTGRNLIHNPLFNVAQRGGGPFTIFGAYAADRWQMAFFGGTLSVGVNALSDANRAQIGDEAAVNALVAVCVGGSGAGDEAYLQHNVEGVRRTAGKTVMLSFWAAAQSGTPRIGCALYQSFGSGGSPSAAVPVSGQAVTLSVGFTRYSLTFSLPSVSGKTFGTNAGTDYLAIRLGLSSGSTNDAAFGTIGVQSNTFAIWGVQLEVGSVVTALEKPDPLYDLSNSQRFYQVIPFYLAAYNVAGNGIYANLPLNTAMRVAPTVTVSGPALTNATAGSVSALNGSPSVLLAQATVTASGQAFYTGTALCSADL